MTDPVDDRQKIAKALDAVVVNLETAIRNLSDVSKQIATPGTDHGDDDSSFDNVLDLSMDLIRTHPNVVGKPGSVLRSHYVDPISSDSSFGMEESPLPNHPADLFEQ